MESGRDTDCDREEVVRESAVPQFWVSLGYTMNHFNEWGLSTSIRGVGR